MQPDALIGLAQGGAAGTIGVLAFFLVLFIRGNIHADTAYRDLMKDRDYWRSIADRALTVNEKFATPVDPVKRP